MFNFFKSGKSRNFQVQMNQKNARFLERYGSKGSKVIPLNEVGASAAVHNFHRDFPSLKLHHLNINGCEITYLYKPGEDQSLRFRVAPEATILRIDYNEDKLLEIIYENHTDSANH